MLENLPSTVKPETSTSHENINLTIGSIISAVLSLFEQAIHSQQEVEIEKIYSQLKNLFELCSSLPSLNQYSNITYKAIKYFNCDSIDLAHLHQSFYILLKDYFRWTGSLPDTALQTPDPNQALEKHTSYYIINPKLFINSDYIQSLIGQDPVSDAHPFGHLKVSFFVFVDFYLYSQDPSQSHGQNNSYNPSSQNRIDSIIKDPSLLSPDSSLSPQMFFWVMSLVLIFHDFHEQVTGDVASGNKDAEFKKDELAQTCKFTYLTLKGLIQQDLHSQDNGQPKPSLEALDAMLIVLALDPKLKETYGINSKEVKKIITDNLLDFDTSQIEQEVYLRLNEIYEQKHLEHIPKNEDSSSSRYLNQILTKNKNTIIQVLKVIQAYNSANTSNTTSQIIKGWNRTVNKEISGLINDYVELFKALG